MKLRRTKNCAIFGPPCITTIVFNEFYSPNIPFDDIIKTFQNSARE